VSKQPCWRNAAVLVLAGIITSCVSAGPSVTSGAVPVASEGSFSYQDNAPGRRALSPEGTLKVTILSRISLPRFWNRIKTLDPMELLLVKSEVGRAGAPARTFLTEIAYRKTAGRDSEYYFGTKKNGSGLTVEFVDTSLWSTSEDPGAPWIVGTWEGQSFSVRAVPEPDGQTGRIASLTAVPPPGVRLSIRDGDGNPLGDLRREEGPDGPRFLYHLAASTSFSREAVHALLGYTASLSGCLSTLQHYRFGYYDTQMTGWPVGENPWDALFGEEKP